jgi:radical SAM protein with 4Fe4S-binding SPASM domain
MIRSILPYWAKPYARLALSFVNGWNYWPSYVFKDGKANPPTTITLEVTYRCNLKCIMCPQSIDLQKPDSILRAQMKENMELTTEEIISIIGQAAAMGVKRFIVTGGEAFLRRDIIEILSAVKENHMTCWIISNGGLMKEGYAKDLVSMGVDRITFSLDGPADIHNKMRQNKHQFHDLLNAVRLIQAEKQNQKRDLPELTFNMTVTAHNAGRMSDLVEIAAQEKVSVNYGYLFYSSKDMEQKTREMYMTTGNMYTTTGIEIEDHNVPMSTRMVDVDLLLKEIEKTEKLADRMQVKINIEPHIKERTDLHNYFYSDEYAYTHHCFYPWFAMRINPYGNVYPCLMSVYTGNLRNNQLKEIWNNEAYVDFRKALRRVGIWPKCTKCCMLNNNYNNRLWNKLPKMRWYWDKNGGGKITK